MPHLSHVICVDWGTSALRLFLVERAGRKILARHASNAGILKTYNDWQARGGERAAHFLGVLRDAMKNLAALTDRPLEGLPVVLSGMASSSIGLMELPYGDLPQPLAACRLPYRLLEANQEFPHPLLLISGLRKAGDVMRGEEVQAMGLPRHHYERSDRLILILPGTHSKHLHLAGSTLVDFCTFMTGELFDILGRHSILARSILAVDRNPPLLDKPFLAGVHSGSQDPLAHALFSLRARQLEGSLTRAEGASYLSGLLLGHELASLRQFDDAPILIAAGPSLREPYHKALNSLDMASRVRLLSHDESEAMVVQGQLHVWEQCRGE